MKPKPASLWLAVSVLALTITGAFKSPADDTPIPAGVPHKSYIGTVFAVDTQEHTLGLKGAFLRKTFNLGNNCTYTFVDKGADKISDLRLGQRIKIVYQESHSVLVANQVIQVPVDCKGTVKAIDPDQRTLTLHERGMDKTFQIAGDCEVVLRGDKDGTLADIQAGNYVTVTYETPGDKPTAWVITQTSETFTGSLTAIDLDTKTVKAKSMFDSRKFTLGDNCAIVINGMINGQLSDLKLNDRLVFSYDEINGVNVVNRIAPAEPAAAQPATK